MYRNVQRGPLTAFMQALFIGPILLTVATRAVSSNFGDSLLAEGLPQWLEKRAIYDGWPGLQPVSIEANLAKRAQERLDRIVQYLDFAFPGAPPSSSMPKMLRGRRVDPKVTVASGVTTLYGGQRSRLNWYPIVLGLIGSLFLLLLAVGAGVAYNEKVRLPRKKTSGFVQEPNGVSRLTDVDDQGVSILRLDGDRKLAHSAQMYHYQYQKQQMLAVEKANEPDNQMTEEVGNDSDSDVVEGDFTVYECPGLASTGELEVQNPLFEGDALGAGVASKTPNLSTSSINCDKQAQGTSDEEESSDSTPTSKTVQYM